MIEPFYGAAIGAGAELLGGAASLFSGNKSAYESRLRYDQNALLQQQNLIDQRNLETFRRGEDIWHSTEFAKKSTGWQFDDLMEAADQAGIHRLAAIGGASGSQYTGSIPSTSSQGSGLYSEAPDDFSFLGDAVSGAMNYMQETKAEKRREADSQARRDLIQAETKLTEARAKTLERQARALTTGGTTGESYPNSEDVGPDKRPRQRPSPKNTKRIPVYSPNGSGPHMIPADLAERYRIKPYGNLSAGDVAELVGELAGEGAAAVTYDEINKNLDGLLYQMGADKKAQNPRGRNRGRTPRYER